MNSYLLVRIVCLKDVLDVLSRYKISTKIINKTGDLNKLSH